MARLLIAALLLLSIGSCRPEVYTPKPSGYFKIDTPAEHTYITFDRPGFPYNFEYPTNCIVQQDTTFGNKQHDNRFWINLYMPYLECFINITYKEISKEQSFYKLMDDAWGLSYFHHEKADYIDPIGFRNDFGVEGTLYTVGGNSASRYQFAATDTVKHFLRGALYFDVTPNADSLKPATDFMVKDIQHLLLTLQWR